MIKIFIYSENDTIRISSNSFTKLKVTINNKHDYLVKQRSFFLDYKNSVSSTFYEAKIYFPKNINDIKIINTFINDTLKISKFNEKKSYKF